MQLLSQRRKREQAEKEIISKNLSKWIEEKEGKRKPVFSWEVLLGDGSLVMDSSLQKPIADIIAKMTVYPGNLPPVK